VNQRGRKSSAALSVARIVGLPQRPEPPPELSPAEKACWKVTVNGLKPGWFDPTTFPLLRAYCCTVANAGLVAARLRELKPGDKGFGALLSLHARLSKQMALLAVRLRITPSSRSSRGDPRDHRAGSGPRPWEFGG